MEVPRLGVELELQLPAYATELDHVMAVQPDKIYYRSLGSKWMHFVVCIFLGGRMLLFFRAAPAAYAVFQAKGRIGVVAALLRQSHSNARSEPCLLPTPQLTATPDS